MGEVHLYRALAWTLIRPHSAGRFSILDETFKTDDSLCGAMGKACTLSEKQVWFWGIGVVGKNRLRAHFSSVPRPWNGKARS